MKSGTLISGEAGTVNATGAKVLLIDDDPDMHHAIRLILEPSGYQVDCQATAAAGLEAIRRGPPDVILLDIMLASPSEGLELAARLKDDEQFGQIPIIILSSIGRQIGADLARQTGVDTVRLDRFLEKPLDAKLLLSAVRDVLEAGEQAG